MKPRELLITLKVKTTLPIKTLRDKEWWKGGMTLDCRYNEIEVLQLKVEVIKSN